MDWQTFAGGAVMGGVVGFVYGVWYKASEHGGAMFLRPRSKVFSADVAVKVASVSHRQRWELGTRRFIGLCEYVQRKDKLGNQLPSYHRLKALTGCTWRKFAPYRDLLADAHAVEVIDRTSATWLLNYHQRREIVLALPYPENRHAPEFGWMRDSVTVRDSVTA